MKTAQECLYSGQPAATESAARVKSVLIRPPDGHIAFHRDKDCFTNHDIRHDDLEVTMTADEWAAFYKVGADNILDHSLEVLGLDRK